MGINQIKVDPFFNSIFLKHFYTHFIKMGKYYKFFLYFFLVNKILKKKKISTFFLIAYIISEHYFSIGTKKKALFKLKKKAKKFKRKRKRKKQKFKKLFKLKVIQFPNKRFFKIIKKFYRAFLIKKHIFFLSKIYNSYLNFFFLFNLNKNKIKKVYIKAKQRVTNIFNSNKKFIPKKEKIKIKNLFKYCKKGPEVHFSFGWRQAFLLYKY